MARSPAHKLGQIIGDHIEEAIRKPLREIAEEFNMYLDYTHIRPVRGRSKKVSWKDSYGNKHDLDYVIEEHGSEHRLGVPRAFIETAWRRYTKHSRNKTQEIQGAVLPLSETYRRYSPFLGVILAGDFTETALQQLRSHGFNVVYAPRETVLKAFSNIGFDVSSRESTTEAQLQTRVNEISGITSEKKRQFRRELYTLCEDEFSAFFANLRNSFSRYIQRISVLTLSGESFGFDCIENAVSFVRQHDKSISMSTFVRYELQVRYSNGDTVRGDFRDRLDAIRFLESFDIRRNRLAFQGVIYEGGVVVSRFGEERMDSH